MQWRHSWFTHISPTLLFVDFIPWRYLFNIINGAGPSFWADKRRRTAFERARRRVSYEIIRPDENRQYFRLHLLSTLADDSDQKRSCCSRWFGRMGPGSMRTSMIAIAITAIGGGNILPCYATCRRSRAPLRMQGLRSDPGIGHAGPGVHGRAVELQNAYQG